MPLILNDEALAAVEDLLVACEDFNERFAGAKRKPGGPLEQIDYLIGTFMGNVHDVLERGDFQP